MNLKSIRWRLPLTYAGLALLTALALGGVLLFVLRGYYAQQEREYLLGNAISLSNAIGPVLEQKLPVDSLKAQIDLFAILSQMQVRVLDGQGKTLVESRVPVSKNAVYLSAASRPRILIQSQDIQPRSGSLEATAVAQGAQPGQSGPPENGTVHAVPVPAGDLPDQPAPSASGSVDAVPAPPEGGSVDMTVIGPFEAPATAPISGANLPTGKLQIFYSNIQGNEAKTLISVIPLAGTMYGFSLQGDVRPDGPRSDQVIRQEISFKGKNLGSIELSNGPTYGRDILLGVARGWLIASLAAVLAAAVVGWLISRRLSAPLLGLVDVTRQMSAGDLTIRAGQAQGLDHADEFGLLAHSFNEMAGQVENTIHTLRRFVSDAAHELNTPLTALRTNLELAAAGKDPDPAIARACEQVHRLQVLTTALLDLSRIESGSAGPAREPVDLKVLLSEVGEIYASQAEQKEIAFELNLPGAEELWISAQPLQIRRVVENLLENALKFTPTGGKIRLELDGDETSARITVADSGIGIPAEDQLLLFSRFHRGRNAAAYPGSGLGLAIVKAILDRHGGEIGILSQEAGGACFEVSLPRLA